MEAVRVSRENDNPGPRQRVNEGPQSWFLVLKRVVMIPVCIVLFPVALIAMVLVTWVLMFPAGVIYSLWRLSGRTMRDRPGHPHLSK